MKLGSKICLAASLLVLAACSRTPVTVAKTSQSDAHFLADTFTWQAQRRKALLAPDGWTSLIGLHWLELEKNSVGSGQDRDIQLEVGPSKLGLVELQNQRVFFTPETGVAVTANGKPISRRTRLLDDHVGAATVIGFNNGVDQMTVIRRGQRVGLRIKSANALARVKFTQLEYWSPDPSWRIEAQFIPSPPGSTLSFVDMVGDTIAAPSPGVVEFQYAGKTYRLKAMEGDAGGLFFVFADRTNGHGSYPAGRFLDTDAADASGKVVLDFNRAYSPPCVFTHFATCPLPAPENRLNIKVKAGEKMYTGPVALH